MLKGVKGVKIFWFIREWLEQKDYVAGATYSGRANHANMPNAGLKISILA
jgi:hypothetical protein